MQEIGLIVVVAGAIFYLGRKFYLNTTKKSGCETDCGCEPVNSKLKSRSRA